MKLVFAEAACEDYPHWQAYAPNLLQRVNDLIGNCKLRSAGFIHDRAGMILRDS